MSEKTVTFENFDQISQLDLQTIGEDQATEGSQISILHIGEESILLASEAFLSQFSSSLGVLLNGDLLGPDWGHRDYCFKYLKPGTIQIILGNTTKSRRLKGFRVESSTWTSYKDLQEELQIALGQLKPFLLSIVPLRESQD